VTRRFAGPRPSRRRARREGLTPLATIARCRPSQDPVPVLELAREFADCLAVASDADPDVQAEAWLTWLHGAEERLGRRLTRSELAAVRDQVRALRAAAPSTDEAVA
jgi:hypothetical protein